MNYKCLTAMEKKLDGIVEGIVEAGTAQTTDGTWRVPLGELAARYGADSDCPSALIRAMLSEREEVAGIAEDIGAFHITIHPEYCDYYQKQLFDPARMQTTAVYTVEEADGPHHFYTEHAGGYSLAYQVTGLLADARRGMSNRVSGAELMPLLVSDYHFLTEDMRLFSPLTEPDVQRLLTACDGETAFHITLKLAEDSIRVESLPNAAECSLPGLTLRLHGRGFSCDKLHEIAVSPEACFASEENVEMDMAKLHEKVFRQTISRNLLKFEECSNAMNHAAQEQQADPAQGEITFT